MAAIAFDDDSLESALNRSLKNAKHLRAAHAATVRAARSLARKIDAWDVIVDWAIEDAQEVRGARPAVPANDNVSLATFLKYMNDLGLTPETAAVPVKGAGVPAKPATPKDELAAMRQKLQAG